MSSVNTKIQTKQLKILSLEEYKCKQFPLLQMFGIYHKHHSRFTSTCGKEWKEKYIILKKAWGKANSICICGPYMSNQSDNTPFFFSPTLAQSQPQLQYLSIFGNYCYLKAWFESRLWLKLWNMKDATSHRQTMVYRSLMICTYWNIHLPCLPSNNSLWDLYKKSGLTASRVL